MKIKQKKLDALLVKKDSLLKKLHSFDFFMKGSITTIHRTVNNKKYPGLFFSSNINGKTKLIYLGDKKKLKAEKGLNNYKKMKILLDDLTKINMEILSIE